MQYEEKVRQLESRFQGEEAASQVKEMEEELRMAKEASFHYNKGFKIWYGYSSLQSSLFPFIASDHNKKSKPSYFAVHRIRIDRR